MHKQQLLDLADHIEQMDPAHFDMRHWAKHPDGPDEHAVCTNKDFDLLLETGHICGTTCCIAGEDFLRSGETTPPLNTIWWFARRHDIPHSWAEELLTGMWSPNDVKERDNKLAASAIRSMVEAIEVGDVSVFCWAYDFREGLS